MKSFLLRSGTTAIFCLLALSSHAQSENLGDLFSKLFGGNNNFSASADFKLIADGTLTAPVKVALLQDKARAEVDLTEVKGDNMDANFIEMVKKAGLQKVVGLFQPDNAKAYIISPALKGFYAHEIRQDVLSMIPAVMKVDITELGKETVGSHACVKNKVKVTAGEEPPLEITTWNATALKNFPVKLEFKDPNNGNFVQISFKDIKLEKPESKQFEGPASEFTSYNTAQELAQAGLQKILNQQ